MRRGNMKRQKKEERHGEKRENKNDERNSGRVRTRRVNIKKRINLFFEVFFNRNKERLRQKKHDICTKKTKKGKIEDHA